VSTSNAEVPAGLSDRTRELHALTEVAKTVTAPLDLSTLLGAVMDKLTDVPTLPNSGTYVVG
jgi:hypothetical protein